LDLSPNEHNWKEKGVKNKKEAINFLKKYPWSSLQSYLGLQNLPFVERSLLSQIYESPVEWERELAEWLPEEKFDDANTRIEP